MAWTEPRTWSNGEVITDVIMNTHVRDNLNALKDVDETTKGVHGLGTGVYLTGCKQGTRRFEVKSGTVTFTPFNSGDMGDADATITVTWAYALSSILACFVTPAPGSSNSEYRTGISSRSATGATAKLGTWYDASGSSYTVNADFLAIGT